MLRKRHPLLVHASTMPANMVGESETCPGPESRKLPPKGSASNWAKTAEGRAAFSNKFHFKDSELADSESDCRRALDSDGTPAEYLVSVHQPSQEWLERMKDTLVAELSNIKAYIPGSPSQVIELAIRRGVQAEYLVAVSQQLKVYATPLSSVHYLNAIREADKVRQPGYDRALTQHFKALEAVAVGIRKLRRQYPPASESEWAGTLNIIFTLATADWQDLFEGYRTSEASFQAMPRRFARGSDDVEQDSVGHPRVFKPDRAMYIPRAVDGFTHLPPRQQRSFVACKDARPRSNALVPIMAAEFKAELADLPQAEGQCLYSLVQAAGVYANLQSTRRMLAVSVANGFAFPRSSSWRHENNIDFVSLIRSKSPLDLGEMAGVIALFLMVREAAESHILVAFDITREGLDSIVSFDQLAAVPVPPGPLVDWRRRTLSPALMKRKRRASQSPAKTPQKRQKTEEEEEEEEPGVEMGVNAEESEAQ
ncbi:hypothetical protein FB451DRAFT_1233326 [Mycena latifolia]|nr:hypothetical protein FB451DRAFT_1233326 [Mycena latifolia]